MKSLVERELKLGPPPGLDLATLGGELQPPRLFESTYFDTADRTLLRRGITLRRRVEADAGRWQLKLPSREARLELEFDVPDEQPTDAVLKLLLALTRRRPVEPVATLRTTRTASRIVADGVVVAEIALDAVAVLDGDQVVAAFDELEIELVHGSEDDLRRLGKRLRKAGATDAPGSMKLARALGLDPVRAPREPGVRGALRAQLETMLDHDPGTRVGVDPEDLHKHRVATRRLRAFLRTAAPLLDETWAAETKEELRWLAGALGGVRDLDVLLDHLRLEAESLDEDEHAAFAAVLTRLEGEREDARRGLLEALESDRYLALLERLAAGPPEPARKPRLKALWRQEHRRALRAVKRLQQTPSDDELHDLRIRVKRARYAAELAGGGDRYVDAAKGVQDVLGAHQDAVVVEDALRRHLDGNAVAALAAGRLIERERERRVRARAEWRDAWDRVERRAKTYD